MRYIYVYIYTYTGCLDAGDIGWPYVNNLERQKQRTIVSTEAT